MPIDGNEVWRKGRENPTNCKALEGEAWNLETFTTSSWMDSFQCLEATQSSICYEDLVISYAYSGSQGFSIRFGTDHLNGFPKENKGKGWGISHFSGNLYRPHFIFSFYTPTKRNRTRKLNSENFKGQRFFQESILWFLGWDIFRPQFGMVCKCGVKWGGKGYASK